MITDHGIDVPGIAIVRSSRGWAHALHRYVVDHGGAIVRTRPLEERQALESDYDILIVDDISSILSQRIVDELHRRGRHVLGVYDPEEMTAGDKHTGRERLLRLGADGVIEAQASLEEFVRLIEDLTPLRQEIPTQQRFVGEPSPVEGPPVPSEGSESGIENDGLVSTATLSQEIDLRTPPGLQKAPDEIVLPPRQVAGRRRGYITALIGVSGGCGVTEVAIELGRSLGRRGERSIVVDGDELSPTLAQRLGLPLHPNLRTAVDVVEHQTGRLSECVTPVGPNLEVLTGIPHQRDWIELRGTDMTAVLEDLARHRPQIIANASPMIEDLSTLGGADRFGISRAVISAADQVIIVCPPTPTGVARVLDRVTDLQLLAPNKPIHIVINRLPKGPFKRNEIAHEIRHSFMPTSLHFLPMDQRVERAGWDGTLIPPGDFTKAVSESLTPVLPRAALPAPVRRMRPQMPARVGAPGPFAMPHGSSGNKNSGNNSNGGDHFDSDSLGA